MAAGESLSSSDALQRAVGFLLAKQNANGGWGESYLACVNKAYPPDGTGQVRVGVRVGVRAPENVALS